MSVGQDAEAAARAARRAALKPYRKFSQPAWGKLGASLGQEATSQGRTRAHKSARHGGWIRRAADIGHGGLVPDLFVGRRVGHV